jgi:hypothetical protein
MTTLPAELSDAGVELRGINAKGALGRTKLLLDAARYLVHARIASRIAKARTNAAADLLEVAPRFSHLQCSERVIQSRRRLAIRTHDRWRRWLTRRKRGEDPRLDDDPEVCNIHLAAPRPRPGGDRSATSAPRRVLRRSRRPALDRSGSFPATHWKISGACEKGNLRARALALTPTRTARVRGEDPSEPAPGMPHPGV